MHIPELLKTLETGVAAQVVDDDYKLIGIRTGGVWVAKHLHTALANPHPLGELDINFYRDDYSRVGLHPEVKPSNIPFSVEDQHIVLVDDVIQTGRTIRAALNEIFDYGRPSRVTLVCLIELTGHELPIRPDVIATTMKLEKKQRVKLRGPDPLSIVVESLI